MFENIEEYILKTRDERRKHLDLNEKCIEIGGIDSTEYRGLVAHFLKTAIPTKCKNIQLCHGCNNGKCSNPKHLYWGTVKDNYRDSIDCGSRIHIWKQFEQKVGKEEAIKRRKEISSKGGKAKRKKKEMSIETIEYYKKIINEIDKQWGWIKNVSLKLEISHTSVRRFIKQYMKDSEAFLNFRKLSSTEPH